MNKFVFDKRVCLILEEFEYHENGIAEMWRYKEILFGAQKILITYSYMMTKWEISGYKTMLERKRHLQGLKSITFTKGQL